MNKINKPLFGIPTSTIPQREDLRVNELKKAIGDNSKSDMGFAIMMNIIGELAGTFKFETDNENLLLQENQFFTNLILNGSIFVSKQNKDNDKFEFYNVSKVEKNLYQEVEKIWVKPLQDYFVNNSAYKNFEEQEFVLNSETKLFSKKRGEPFQGVLIYWNNTSYSFWVWGEPFLKRMVRTHNQIDLSMRLSNKKWLYRQNNNNEQVAIDLQTSIEDTENAFVKLVNPSIYTKRVITPNTEENIIEELKTSGTSGLNVKDAIEYLQLLRDAMGMSGSAQPIKAERNITNEFEVADRNTNNYEETIMRNLRRLEKFLNDNGAVIKIAKVREEEQEKEDIPEEDNFNEDI